MSSASPKRNRSKVQKKGSHGGSRAGAGQKPSSSKLAVTAKGASTLHTMGFKADDGTKVTTTTGATTSAGATAASGSSSDEFRRSDVLSVKSSILTTSLSARIAAPSEIRKGIGRFYPLLNEKIPGAGAPWTPLESLGALRAPRVGASRLLQLD